MPYWQLPEAVPYSGAISIVLPGDLWCRPRDPAATRKEATSSAGSAQRSPTVRRRELGALLRALRNERGLTVEQVAERLLCSPSKVSRMETGAAWRDCQRDVRDLCDLYGVTRAADARALMPSSPPRGSSRAGGSRTNLTIRHVCRTRARRGGDKELSSPRLSQAFCRRRNTLGRCMRPAYQSFLLRESTNSSKFDLPVSDRLPRIHRCSSG